MTLESYSEQFSNHYDTRVIIYDSRVFNSLTTLLERKKEILFFHYSPIFVWKPVTAAAVPNPEQQRGSCLY